MVQDHTVKPGGPGNVVRSGVEEELKENLKQEKYFYTKIRSHQILTNTECVCVWRETKWNRRSIQWAMFLVQSVLCGTSLVLYWYWANDDAPLLWRHLLHTYHCTHSRRKKYILLGFFPNFLPVCVWSQLQSLYCCVTGCACVWRGGV